MADITWSPGDIPTAAQFNSNLTHTGNGWNAYTPAWSGTLGNGSISGAYFRAGRFIAFELSIAWGSTTSHAASAQTISIPVQIANANALRTVGIAVAALTGPSAQASGVVLFTAGTVTCQILTSNTFWTNASPQTWANGSVLYASGTYQSAS